MRTIAVSIIGLCMVACLSVQGQVIYHEDFSSSPLTAGAGFLPSGMTSLRSDTLTDIPDYRNLPFSDVAFSSEGWAVRTLGGNPCAVATAGVSETGLVDRWMFSPVIYGNNQNSVLIWREATYNPTQSVPSPFYEVWITNDTAGTPDPSQFTASAANRIFQSTAHEVAMLSRRVSLSNFSAAPFRIAFRLKEFNMPAKWQVAVDDITVINPASGNDLSLDQVYTPVFVSAGDTVRVGSLLTNLNTTVSSCQWNIRIGSFIDSAQVSLTLNVNQTGQFLYDLMVPQLTPGEYPMECWVSKPDGNSDYNNGNDTLRQLLHIISVPVARNVLAEEFTGAWCGDCPLGGLEVDHLESSRPWMIPVSIHTGDSMVIDDCDDIAYRYSMGYPSLIPDRQNVSADYTYSYWADYTLEHWDSLVDKRHGQPSIATVSVVNQNFDWSTRILDVTVEVAFLNDATGPFALNCWLTEDNVFGPVNDTSDNHWNNHSYHNNDSASVFYGMGSLLDPSEYVHNNVVVKILSGNQWGDTSALPASVTAGSSYLITYQDTLPVNQGGAHIWIPQDMSVVCFVTLFNDYSLKQEVINASTTSFNTSISEIASVGRVSLYPNPATEVLNLKMNTEVSQTIQVRIVNVLGEVVSAQSEFSLAPGESILTFPTVGLGEGIYYVEITSENGQAYVPFVRVSAGD